MVVTEPIPELLEKIGWTTHTGLADSREMLYYLRRTDDDRIAIGGGGMGAVATDAHELVTLAVATHPASSSSIGNWREPARPVSSPISRTARSRPTS